MEIQFKDVKQEDFTLIKEIYDWYIANSTATFHTEPISIEELKEFIYINHPTYKSYMIEVKDEVVGYCYFTYFKKRQAYNRTAELTLYLKPNCCKRGIGTMTLRHLERVAAENGLKTLLGIITGDNEGSIALFEKCGYTKCAHFKKVGEKFNKILDVVAFQKEL